MAALSSRLSQISALKRQRPSSSIIVSTVPSLEDKTEDTVSPAASHPVYGFHTVWISDVHFSSGTTAAAYLYEFLSNLDSKKLKKLYLVGDIIDGWERGSGKQRSLPEMERRCIDIINYFAAQGIEAIYIPGNHDEKLRPLVELLDERESTWSLPGRLRFARQDVWASGGEDSKRFQVYHGDENDPPAFYKGWIRPLTFMVSRTYDILVRLNHALARTMYENFSVHISIASGLKKTFKDIVGWFFSHDSLIKGLKTNGYDGIISGHTHTAMKKIHTHPDGRQSYLINDGDWVEDCDFAATMVEGELPEIYHYKLLREQYGFGDLPGEDDPHPAHFAAQRIRTDRQVRLIHRLWPAATRAKQVDKLFHARKKYAEHTQDHDFLTATWEKLARTGVVSAKDRHVLTDIFGETNKDAYKKQRKMVAAIFARTAEDASIEGRDRLVVQNVIRQYITRSERKIAKHLENMDKAAEKLDMHSAARGLTMFKP